MTDEIPTPEPVLAWTNIAPQIVALVLAAYSLSEKLGWLSLSPDQVSAITGAVAPILSMAAFIFSFVARKKVTPVVKADALLARAAVEATGPAGMFRRNDLEVDA